MRKMLLLALGMLLLYVHVAAQSRTISGKVTDNAGSPVPNASITVKGTSIGTTSKADGGFSLSVPETAKQLEVSSVGFAVHTFDIGSGNVLNISLVNASNEIAEVVVTGYTNVKKSQFAGAATVIGASKIVENRPVGSFNHLLQGRVPGMLVNSGTGQPGANAQVTIRGVQSIQGAGAQPLYIIDGVPTNAGDFQSLNPNDFETMTVLKDANAAALYGARAGTGVIVITTKQGKAGQTQFLVRAQTGITKAPDFSRLNLMNTKELLEYEEKIGLFTNSSNAAFGVPGWVWSRKNPANAALPETTLLQYDHLLDSVRNINTDLTDLLFRTGVTQTYEVSARGGTDKTTFFISAGVFDQQGIDLTAGLRRYTARFNLGHNAGKLKIQWNNLVGFSITNYAEGDQQGNSTRNPFQMIYRAKPYDNPYKADGTLNFGGGGSNTNLKTLANLLEGIENSSYAHKQIKLNSGLTTSFAILDNLVLKNVFGVDVGSNQLERYIIPNSYVGQQEAIARRGIAQESFGMTTQLSNTTSLVYNKTLGGKHDFSVGAYFEAVRVYNKGLGFTLRNLNPLLPNTGQGAAPLPTNGDPTYPQNASSASSEYGIRSYFGTVGYTFDQRISINANVRRDGTSRIVNPDFKQITTWSAGAIWNVINERFMEKQNVLSDLRLRASYGIVPNIGSIPTQSYPGTVLWTVTNYAGPQVPYYNTNSYVGSTIPGIIPANPGNELLEIEKIHKANIGLDFAFLNNRLRFVVDGYQNKTKDLFVRQPLAAGTGFGNLDINAGIMTNTGIELMIDADIVRTKDWNVSLGFNHAMNDNKIKDLGAVNEYFLGTFVIREGLPYGSHYTYNYLGVDQSNGAPIFEKADGTTTNQRAQAGQFAKFGTYLPKHVGGFNAEVRWKRFSAQAFFSYQFDVVRSNNTRNWIIRGTTGYAGAVNQSRELITGQWFKPGDNAKFNSPAWDRDFTSADLEDAKFLRFRNLNIAYDIPALNFAPGKSIIKGGTAYVNFFNLAVWSPWNGVDPEDNNNISLVEYPNPRMIVFGLDIKL
jgi:TonB-linked SusC/RagA family outer membrane protein